MRESQNEPETDIQKKLFAVYLGGRVNGCHIELHDIRFVVGETIDTTIPTLIQEWIGDKKTVHIDAYVELKEIEGFDVRLSEKPAREGKKLYFVNLGGYDKTKFTELHDAGFFVAGNANEAKKKAKRLLLSGADQQHKDDLFEVDDCLAVERVGGVYIQLVAAAEGIAWAPLKPDWCGYKKIGKEIRQKRISKQVTF